MKSVVATKMAVSPTTAQMTTRDSRQRPKIQRNTTAASAVRAMIVGVADSVVMILLSEMPSCWRYSTSRLWHVGIPLAERRRREGHR